MNPNDWKDEQPQQGKLIEQTENRADKDTRLDRGASDQFADDRAEFGQKSESDQSALIPETVGDGNQADLFGEKAQKTPGWQE